MSKPPALARREWAALLATPLLSLVFLFPLGGWLFAFFAPLTLWPAFSRSIREDRDFDAWCAGLLWAVLLSVGVIAFSWFQPELAGQQIVRGGSYRDEMFHWIRTGIGKEGDWKLFLPEHAAHLLLFIGLASLSGGYLGLVLGAGLLAYMNYFVVSVMLASDHPAMALATAWFPWSVARVLAFLAIGTLLARPILCRRRAPFSTRHRLWFGIAGAGLLLDVLLKISLASLFRERLMMLLESIDAVSAGLR